MFLSEDSQPPELKSGVASKVEIIDRQIGELTLLWDQAQDNPDLSRQLARLWEERFELKGDGDSLKGALYFYQHIHGILSGSDPSIVRKLEELQLKQLDLYIKPLEGWVAEWGGGVQEDTTKAGELLADMKKAKAEMLAKQEMEQVLFGGKTAKVRVEFW